MPLNGLIWDIKSQTFSLFLIFRLLGDSLAATVEIKKAGKAESG